MNGKLDPVDAFSIFLIDDAIFVAVSSIVSQGLGAVLGHVFAPELFIYSPLPMPTEAYGTPPTRSDVLPDSFTANKWIIGALVVGGVMLGAAILEKKK